MRVSLQAIAILVLTCSAGWAVSIRLSAQADTCFVIAAPPGIGTFSVEVIDTAILGCDGLTGAEFRISGLPREWLAITTPTPGAYTVSGDLFGDGVRIYFPQAQYSDPLLLFTVTLWPPSPGAAAILRVDTLVPPPYPFFPCPGVLGGDCGFDPGLVCAGGGVLYVNSDRCTVGIEPGTWSQVKRLYD